MERPEAIERCADVRGPINASKSECLAEKVRGSGKKKPQREGDPIKDLPFSRPLFTVIRQTKPA